MFKAQAVYGVPGGKTIAAGHLEDFSIRKLNLVPEAMSREPQTRPEAFPAMTGRNVGWKLRPQLLHMALCVCPEAPKHLVLIQEYTLSCNRDPNMI